MNDRLGWFGQPDQMLHYLRTVGADRDAEGQFLVAGMPVVLGLGGLDVVVPTETVYFVGGQPCGLAAGLRGTSYGIGMVVL